MNDPARERPREAGKKMGKMKKCKMQGIDVILPFILAVLVMVVISSQDSGIWGWQTGSVTKISKDWYYKKDGEKIPVTLPAVIKQEEGESLTLYYDGLTAEDEDTMITTRAAAYKPVVYLDEELLYRYEDEQFPRNVQMAAKYPCNVLLEGQTEGKTLSVVYQNTGEGVWHIPEMYKGSRAEVFRFLCRKEAVLFGTVFAMIVLGVLTIGIALYLRYIKMAERRFMDSAFFILICGVWFVTDSSIAQLLSGSSPIVLYISFYAFMLLAVPMLYFVKHTGGMDKYWQIDLGIYAFYANAIIQSLLHYFKGIELADMLFVTHLLLTGAVILVVILMRKEYRERHNKELLRILHALYVLSAGGVSAMCLYWILETPNYGMFFNCGLIIFVILLIRILIIAMVENLRFKAETMVYRRLEKEDRLTGLKNRKAFDEDIMELEQTAGNYKDVVLIFMDLNHLKDINDRFGYSVGNEAIITTARCIERAYGENGSCYRIGGDEFVAVLPDETAGDAEICERLNTQITMYNKSGRYRLSIARGISRLRDQQGNLKTVSDWKREADIGMHENKGWVRR